MRPTQTLPKGGLHVITMDLNLNQHLHSGLSPLRVAGGPLFVYTASAPPRLRYIFDLIFRDILGIEYKITHDAEAFAASNEPKISYAEKAIGNELFFYATPLLFEKRIKPQDINVFDWEDTKGFFATHPKYAFPFDPFAASFYLTSRYEEYLPSKKDYYDRFDPKESLAYNKGFLQKPIINIWAEKIKRIIQERYPQLSFAPRKYQYISTIDIDNAFAYKEKGIVRTAGAFARTLANFNFKELGKRTGVLLGLEEDPYETFDLLADIQKKHELNCIYFFLLGDYAENDKNVPISSKELQDLIKSIADYNDIGIHPSFLSNTQTENLKKEIERLSKVLKRPITKSRQHFLKLTLPDTYRRLIENDITDDYTMGYSTEPGFRASLCTPFYFYDLNHETTTKLSVHPFAVMDATLKYHMKINPNDALSYIAPLINEVKQVNGTFISLWHNESLSEIEPWEGWGHIYEEMIKIAAN